MSMKYLGESFDIHGGGADLIFPHHENEIAQSESATGKPFARYWIHNGFVNIRAEKMSKSLGNILTVQELLGQISPCALKLFLLGTHYRAPVEFSEDALISARAAEDRFRYVLDEVQRVRDTLSPSAVPSRMEPVPLVDQVREAEKEFTDAMDDDFNTPRALAALFNLTKGINVALRDAESTTTQSLVRGIATAGETLRRLGSVLGGLFEGLEQTVSYIGGMDTSVGILDVRADQERVRTSIESGQPLPKDAVNRIVEYRNQKRDQKDWTTADAIRDWLADIGVIVDDTVQGARWYVKATHVKTHQS